MTFASKKVIKIFGSNLSLLPKSAPQTLSFGYPVYIDGSNTHIDGPTTGSVFLIDTAVTLSHLSFDTTATAVAIGANVDLRLFDVTSSGKISAPMGTLTIIGSTFVSSTFSTLVQCMGGTVSIDHSEFQHTSFSASNCTTELRHSRFDELGDGGFSISGGKATVENNIVVQTSGGNDSSFVGGVLSGSVVRFNTFVSVDSPSDGVAFGCDDTVEVTDNIFAYSSQHPHGPNEACTTRYSLYDQTALAAQTVGVGNVVGDVATFFVNRTGNDFHLKVGSPAIGAGEAAPDVVDDIEGQSRPSPAGSKPDLGAYEAR